MTRCLSGRKAFVHNVKKLAVVSVLEALIQRVSKDPTNSKHHSPDQNQRNWQKKKILIQGFKALWGKCRRGGIFSNLHSQTLTFKTETPLMIAKQLPTSSFLSLLLSLQIKPNLQGEIMTNRRKIPWAYCTFTKLVHPSLMKILWRLY